MTVTLSGAPRDERALHVLGRGLIDRQRGDLFQLRLFDEAVQSVAAEDEDVVLFDVERAADVDLDVLADAHRALQNVAPRMRLRFFRRQQSLAHHRRDQRMILGDLPDLVAAHEVDARVADVREPGLVVLDDERRGRRPHPAQIRIRLRLGENPRVRARERFAQRLRRCRRSHCRGIAP